MNSPEKAHALRARARAFKFLKPGDVVVATGCGGIRRRVTFLFWEGYWICGKTVNDVSPLSVYRVNGKPVSFRDEGGLPFNEEDQIWS